MSINSDIFAKDGFEGNSENQTENNPIVPFELGVEAGYLTINDVSLVDKKSEFTSGFFASATHATGFLRFLEDNYDSGNRLADSIHGNYLMKDLKTGEFYYVNQPYEVTTFPRKNEPMQQKLHIVRQDILEKVKLVPLFEMTEEERKVAHSYIILEGSNLQELDSYPLNSFFEFSTHSLLLISSFGNEVDTTSTPWKVRSNSVMYYNNDVKKGMAIRLKSSNYYDLTQAHVDGGSIKKNGYYVNSIRFGKDDYYIVTEARKGETHPDTFIIGNGALKKVSTITETTPLTEDEKTRVYKDKYLFEDSIGYDFSSSSRNGKYYVTGYDAILAVISLVGIKIPKNPKIELAPENAWKYEKDINVALAKSYTHSFGDHYYPPVDFTYDRGLNKLFIEHGAHKTIGEFKAIVLMDGGIPIILFKEKSLCKKGTINSKKPSDIKLTIIRPNILLKLPNFSTILRDLELNNMRKKYIIKYDESLLPANNPHEDKNWEIEFTISPNEEGSSLMCDCKLPNDSSFGYPIQTLITVNSVLKGFV